MEQTLHTHMFIKCTRMSTSLLCIFKSLIFLTLPAYCTKIDLCPLVTTVDKTLHRVERPL